MRVQCSLCGVEWINCSDSTRVTKLKQFNVNVTTICAIRRALHALCIYILHEHTERALCVYECLVSALRLPFRTIVEVISWRRHAECVPNSKIKYYYLHFRFVSYPPCSASASAFHHLSSAAVMSLLLSNDDKNGVSSLTNPCAEKTPRHLIKMFIHAHTRRRHRSVKQQWFLVRLNTFLLTYSRCMHACSIWGMKQSVCVGVGLSSVVSLLLEQIIRSMHITYEHVHACLNRRLYADKQTKWILAFFAGIRIFAIYGATPAAVTTVVVAVVAVSHVCAFARRHSSSSVSLAQ